MKKSVWSLVLLVLLCTVNAYSDTTRGDALANAVNLVDDSTSLFYFPARLLEQRSAVFLRVGDADSAVYNTVFHPGIQLIQEKIAFSYLYGRSLGTTPAMMANPALGFVNAPFSAPISIIVAKPGKTMDMALGYTLGLYSVSERELDLSGVLSNLQISSYQLHRLQPSVKMDLSKESTLDLSLILALQFLQNTDQTPNNTNQVLSSSPLHTLALNAQYTRPFGKKTQGAVRLGAALTNQGYLSITGAGSTNASTNQQVNKLWQFDLAAGIKYQAFTSVDIFFDVLMGYRTVDLQNIQNTTNVVSSTDSSAIILPVSTRLGIEFTTGNWLFRMAVQTSMKADIIRNGTVTSTLYGPLTVLPSIGIGWHKGDWVINTVINPMLFNRTIYLVSGQAVTPIFQVSLNYLFPGKKSHKGTGDGSQ